MSSVPRPMSMFEESRNYGPEQCHRDRRLRRFRERHPINDMFSMVDEMMSSAFDSFGNFGEFGPLTHRRNRRNEIQGRPETRENRVERPRRRSLMDMSLPAIFEDFSPFMEGSPFRGIENKMEEFDEGFFNHDLFGPSRGQHLSQVMMSSSQTGPDGKVHQENFFRKNKEVMNEEGQRVGESEEAYQNTENGLKKHSHGRYLGDKAAKVVKTQTADGPEEVHTHFHNVPQEEQAQFEQTWENQNEAIRSNQDPAITEGSFRRSTPYQEPMQVENGDLQA